jgi:hypothetical protein
MAVVGGAFGLHRFYLYGLRDMAGWLFPLPTLLGLYGLQRLDHFGQDDRVVWMLLPLLGVSLSAAMISAIVYGLTPDEKWTARHDPGSSVRPTGWGPVLGVVVALMIGAIALTSTIAYGGQRFFEWQLERARDLSR